MAGLPMAHMLNFEEFVPTREYSDFADDVRKRWQQEGTADAHSYETARGR
jgi:hypothetical protein